MFGEINSVLTELETGCNIVDTIPVVGILSSALRTKAGHIQTIAGAILFVGGIIGVVIGNDSRHWNKVVHIGCEQTYHGMLNTIRGIGTLLLAAAGVNIILLGWQLIRTEGFAPVNSYGQGFVPRFAR